MPSKPLSEAWLEHDRRIGRYVWTRRGLGAAEFLLGAAFLAFLLAGSRGGLLERWLAPRFPRPFALWLAYFGLLGLAWELVSFPLSWGFQAVERSWGLSRQGFAAWLWDKVKGGLVGAALGAAALGLVFLSQVWFGERWWLACAVLFILLSILLAQLAPVLLIPIFFTLKPMETGPLKERLLGLCARHGVSVREIYHWGLGEKTEKGNAAFTGLGRTKRILIGDTLYEKFPPEEVEAVFAHELGHQVHNDLWKGLGLSSAQSVLAFGLAAKAAAPALALLKTDVSRPFGVLVFFAVLSAVEAPLAVMQRAYSRRRERFADRFARDLGLGARLSSALERLTLQNFGFFAPHPALEFLFYTHPAPWRRVESLR